MHVAHVILVFRLEEVIDVNIFQMGANNSALTEGEDAEKVFQNEVPISV